MIHPIPLPLRDDCLFIDNSTFETFSTCPRQGEYYFCRKRETAGTRPALFFGDLIHKALEHRYKTEFPYHQTPAVEAEMVGILEKGYETYTPPDGEFRTLSFGVELINTYGVKYPFEGFQVYNNMVERSFAIPIGEVEINADVLVLNPDTFETSVRHLKKIHIIWTGKIDLVIQQNNVDGLMCADHKTTSMMGPSFFKDFELSHPMLGYNWAARHITGQPVIGHMMNAIATRKPTRTGTSLEMVRQFYRVEDHQLEEWRMDTMHAVTSIVSQIVGGYLPKHTKWCLGKYGECQYHKVCTMRPEHREIMLSSGEYQDVTWSPLKEVAQ